MELNEFLERNGMTINSADTDEVNSLLSEMEFLRFLRQSAHQGRTLSKISPFEVVSLKISALDNETSSDTLLDLILFFDVCSYNH